MTKLAYTLLIVIVVLLGLTFTYKNHQTVELIYYFDLHWRGQLSLLLYITFGLGVVVGWLVNLLSSFKTKRKLSHANRQINSLTSNR